MLQNNDRILINGERMLFQDIETLTGGCEKYFATPIPKILNNDGDTPENWDEVIQYTDGDILWLPSYYNTTEAFILVIKDLKCSDGVAFIPKSLYDLIKSK